MWLDQLELPAREAEAYEYSVACLERQRALAPECQSPEDQEYLRRALETDMCMSDHYQRRAADPEADAARQRALP